jgi:autotransporter translocation and assembly factor TamB
LLHASNFTFRGNLTEPDRATASLWGELTGLTWRDRTAEALMLGAALYNRKIELQQVYIRQKSNQFTLSGEAALPASSSEWLRPDFRGNVSASINQLGEFLALFGANPVDFAGKISIQGSMDTHGRNFGGNLAIEGASLTFFEHDIDSFSAKVTLKPSELEIERFDLARKKDSLSGEGKIDLSPEHKYSGTLDAWTNDLRDYVSTLRGSPRQNAGPIPVELQATIDSSQWDTRGAIHLPKSSPLSFTASFPLPIGVTWNAFQMSPLKVSLNFPALFLAAAPQFFPSNILEDGILSGKISLSETLARPRIVGEVQLVNGKLASSGSFLNVIGASTLAVFDGNHASLEFLNLATKDVDLALRGEIDFENTKQVVIRIAAATPIFDLLSRSLDCVNKIEIAPTALPLAPAATELEFRGPLLQSGWSVSLKEEIASQFSIVPTPDSTQRTFPLCIGTGPEEKTLLLGAVPRAEVTPQARPKEREKQR